MHEQMHAVSITSHIIVLQHDKFDPRLAGALRLKTCARRVPELGKIGCCRTVSGRTPLRLGKLMRMVCHAHMHASCLRACSRHRQKTAVSGELGDAGQGRRNPRTRAGPMCTLHVHVFMQKWEHVACHVARRRCSGHHERACHMPRGGIKS